jgi:D-alanyl-lipoteichoic acid acyltransferase DltB (MBOAT superfamily)
MRLVALCFIGFAIHYWLPSGIRYPFYVGYSVLGSVFLLGLTVGVLLLGMGLFFFLVIRSPLPWWLRISLILLVGMLLTVGRGTGAPGVPEGFWPVLGSLFMFRMIVYLYDVRFAKTPPRLIDFLGYFYLLPNYYFLLFPVVDHQTYLVCRDRRPLDVSAQVGIHWIVRGTVQLVLYRLVEIYRPEVVDVGSVSTLIGYVVMTYLLYMRVSGTFHIAIGMLHLFGFDLPETHRKYLLASSIADFWRRINIYWKDFIVKVFYLPVFFKLRAKGELKAAAIATVIAFLATWILHSYQWYWLLGRTLLTWPDTLFWAILGGMMVWSTVEETRRGGRPVERGVVRHAFGVLRTFVVIVMLWSLWQSPSVSDWIDLIMLRGGS